MKKVAYLVARPVKIEDPSVRRKLQLFPAKGRTDMCHDNGTLPAAAIVKARDGAKRDVLHAVLPCAWPRASMACKSRCYDREL